MSKRKRVRMHSTEHSDVKLRRATNKQLTALDASMALRRAAVNYVVAYLRGGPIKQELQAIDALDKVAIVYTDAVRKRRG